jgi:hypothetical protein
MPEQGGKKRVTRPRTWVRDALLLVVVFAVAVPAVLLVAKSMTHDDDLKMVAAASASAAALPSPTGAPQSCTSCWVDKGAPSPDFPGQTTLVDGVQVLNVGLVGGYYRPNRFTVQAGVPVKVVFTGYAQDCLGQPEFPELGLKGDLSSGQAVFPLGELEPGTYQFTCSMGVNEGEITAE